MNSFYFSNGSTPNTYDVIRVFLWARQTVEGGKDPGAFVIATCELAGHILIYNRQEYDSIGWKKIKEAHQEACDTTFAAVKPKVIQLLTYPKMSFDENPQKDCN